MPRKWKGNKDEEDYNCDRGLHKNGIETVGEEWRKRATDRKNWRLLTENVVRAK